MQATRVIAANQNRKGILEAKRSARVNAPSRRVFGAYALGCRSGIGDQRQFEDALQGRANVLHVHIDLARDQRLMRDQRTSKVQTAIDVEFRLRFNLLRQYLSENQ